MQQKKTAEQAQNDWNETYYELSRLYGEAEYKKKENPVLLKAASDDDFYHIQELWDRVEKERPTQTRYRTIEQMEDSIADLNEIITLLVEVLKSRNSSKKKEKLEVMNQETAEDLTQSLSNLRGKFG